MCTAVSASATMILATQLQCHMQLDCMLLCLCVGITRSCIRHTRSSAKAFKSGEIVMKLTVMRMVSTTEWYSSSFRNPSNGEKPLQSIACTTLSLEKHFHTCTCLLLVLTQQQEARHRMHCGHCTPVSPCSCLWLTASCLPVASDRLACYHEVSAERFRLLPHFCRSNRADLLRDCTSCKLD